MEYRIKDVELQCGDEGLLKIGGYINVTERESEMLYSKKRGKWFKEVMKRGVFKSAISRAKEIPLLLEHNWNKQLASTRNSSLSLKEDQIGLRFDAVIEDESIYEQVKSGVINSCSFGFRALQEEIQEINSRLEKRFVTGIELLEVSLVKNPAYVGSLVESRAYEEELETGATPEVVEETEVEKVEDAEVTTEVVEETVEEIKETEEIVEETEDRNVASDVVVQAVSVEENDVKEQLEEIVDELIEKKQEQIELAENYEQGLQNQLESVKEEHKMIEEEIEKTSNLLSVEIIKLRLELLKLKNIKEGM